MPAEQQSGRTVGYGSPPEKTRFKAGNRGNPWGRKGKPKKVVAFEPDQVIAAIFAEEIEIIRKGKRQKVSNLEAVLRVFLARAMKGDIAAGKFLLSLLTKLDLAGISAGLARKAEAQEDTFLQDAAREMMILFAAEGASTPH
jgi:hypothetical protein